MLIYILYLRVILITILGSEFGAYLWHRFAHTDVIPPIRNTHKIHHHADLTHEAHEDFYWVVLLLALGLAGIIINYYYNIIEIPIIYLILLYGIITTVFVWNWYIHSAYHIPNHWLNQYNWFKRDKKIHFQHHINPRANYGIASHFSDIIFGTYEYPLYKPEILS